MNVNVHRPRAGRSALVALAALLLGLVSTLVAVASAHAAAGCTVTYSAYDWGSGFTGNLSVTNLGDPLTSWKLEWDYAGNQQVTQGWSGTYAQSASHVPDTSLTNNGSLAPFVLFSLGF